ncbi:MAG TPA: hypothetical protein VF474_07185 [Phenylobacterium sp.]
MDPTAAAGREALLQGRHDDAAPLFAAQVEANPGDHEARYWLASALMLLDPELAEQVLNDARTLHAMATARTMGADLRRLKGEPDYANTIARQLRGQGLVAMSSVIWGMALAAGRNDPMTFDYALALQHQGRVEEASSLFRQLAQGHADSELHQFSVYAELFCDDGERRHAMEAQAWASRHAKAPPPAPHANQPLAGRKVRVGYVAPNFATSQLRQFITPIIENHDPEAVEVILYPADAATETTWPGWIQVHPMGKLGDAEAAALVRRDRIDVLVDCWGHTAGSRLAVFAHKPAPVQVAWINFAQTTGLPQMDYVFHAASDHPPAFGDLFTEHLWPVGSVFTPFRPGDGRLPPTPTPARATGELTFGSYNHPAKLSPGMIAVWAAVLRGVPASRLLLKYRYFADPVLQRVLQAQFAAHGVAPERLVFSAHSSGEAYFSSFQQVDVMLDSWPNPGSTTTLEALSNGVPVLAMVGDTPNVGGFYARTILEAAGQADMVTTSAEAFIDRALELAEDLDQLDALRSRVRPGFDASAICDEAGFAAGLERAYAEMFERSRVPAPAASASSG